MIHFEGDRTFTQPLAAVAAKLSDASFLVGCLPDVKAASVSPDHAAWKMKPKLSFITGSLDTVMDVTAREPGQSAAYKIVSKAIGASSTVTATLRFSSTDSGGTAVHWIGELVEVTGLLKMVPKGLLQGTAEKVIDDVWVAIAAKLAE
ncbi:MAG TPA: SRPBCC domain-containing protein [Urbifossiella sp.]|jgi:carbon monoxide dehydrogenase subunit G